MKQSEIRFSVELDDKNVPDKIFWEATESPSGKLDEAKAVAISVWDHQTRETLRLDLWTKDMPVFDMKIMCIDTIGGLGETIRSATNDEVMADAIDELCMKLVEKLKAEKPEN